MDENEILENLYKELRLDLWWTELIGQERTVENFNYEKAEKALPRTEVKTAEEIERKFGNLLTYVESQARWYIWDGKIHKPCEGDITIIKVVKFFYNAACDALEFIQDTVRRNADKAAAPGGPDAEEKAKKIKEIYKNVFGKHRTFRDRLASDAGLSACLKMVRSNFSKPSAHFENDQRWFVARNCVIDLDLLRKKGEWTRLEHDPARPVTKFFDADLDYDTNLGHWDKFIESSLPDKEVREHIQKIVGAAFMGTSKLKVICNLMGLKDSGKSIFIETFFKLGKEGAGYAAMPDSNAIIKTAGQNFNQDKFKGKRFIAISEPDAHERIDDAFLKKFSGDDWVETNDKYMTSGGWVPQGVLFIASNLPLKFDTREKAITERIQVINFPNQFKDPAPDVLPELEKIEGLGELLLEDRSRVLTWVLQGMAMWASAGFKLYPPQQVLASREELISNASAALRWVDEYVEQGMLEIDYTVELKYCIPIMEAYERYKMWSNFAGERKPLTRRFFTHDIENRYNEGEKSKEGRFAGLKMTPAYLVKFENENSRTVDGRF